MMDVPFPARQAGEGRGEVAVGHQRSRGTLHVTFKSRNGPTALADLRQEGCLKARLPRPEPGAYTTAITLNTAGGVAGGDVLHTHAEAGPGTHATIAAQAAERIYRALPGAPGARVHTRLRVAEDASLDWLPQETILFDACALDRALDIDLAPGARFTGVERLVFGRTAMGETVRSARLRDVIRLRVDGRLVLHDAIRFDGAVQAVLDRGASGGGARAVATVLHAGPGAASHLNAVRTALEPFDAGASCWDDVLVVRIVATGGGLLRAAVVAVLAVLRAGRPLPRVWTC